MGLKGDYGDNLYTGIYLLLCAAQESVPINALVAVAGTPMQARSSGSCALNINI